jgi:hypothetical protein
VNVQQCNDNQNGKEDLVDGLGGRELGLSGDRDENGAINAHEHEYHAGRVRKKDDGERVHLAKVIVQQTHVEVEIHLEQVITTARDERANVNDGDEKEIAKGRVLFERLLREYHHGHEIAQYAQGQYDGQKDFLYQIGRLFVLIHLIQVCVCVCVCVRPYCCSLSMLFYLSIFRIFQSKTLIFLNRYKVRRIKFKKEIYRAKKRRKSIDIL